MPRLRTFYSWEQNVKTAELDDTLERSRVFYWILDKESHEREQGDGRYCGSLYLSLCRIFLSTFQHLLTFVNSTTTTHYRLTRAW